MLITSLDEEGDGESDEWREEDPTPASSWENVSGVDFEFEDKDPLTTWSSWRVLTVKGWLGVLFKSLTTITYWSSIVAVVLGSVESLLIIVHPLLTFRAADFSTVFTRRVLFCNDCCSCWWICADEGNDEIEAYCCVDKESLDNCCAPVKSFSCCSCLKVMAWGVKFRGRVCLPDERGLISCLHDTFFSGKFVEKFRCIFDSTVEVVMEVLSVCTELMDVDVGAATVVLELQAESREEPGKSMAGVSVLRDDEETSPEAFPLLLSLLLLMLDWTVDWTVEAARAAAKAASSSAAASKQQGQTWLHSHPSGHKSLSIMSFMNM